MLRILEVSLNVFGAHLRQNLLGDSFGRVFDQFPRNIRTQTDAVTGHTRWMAEVADDDAKTNSDSGHSGDDQSELDTRTTDDIRLRYERVSVDEIQLTRHG